MRPCWGSSPSCTESDLDINFPHWQKWLDEAKPIHDAGDGTTTVFMLQDEEHFVKEGPTDLIAWEYQVYTRVQELLHFPTVCERFLDLRWNSGKQGLLLHLVVCFRDIFKGDAFPHPSKPFTYTSTALCAYHLIRCMRLMHHNGVLQRDNDIHPGNVGVLCAHDSSIQPAHITMQEIEELQPLFTPTFIDYQWSTMDGYHPRRHMPTMAMWLYLSDRILREPNATYSAADDLESLTYTLLEFRPMGELPWAREIDARSNPFYYDVDSREHRDFVIATRNQHLDRLFNSCTAASPSSPPHPVQVEKELLDFVQYARNLERSDRIDYAKWEGVFQGSITRDCV